MRGLLRWLRRGGVRRRPRDGTAALGERGERLAAKWLRRRGYRVLHRRYAIGNDEADLIAVDPDGKSLVIVEVKTRSAGVPGPEAALGREKQHRMARLAARIRERREFRDRPLRFDAVAIVWPEGGEPEVRHYRDAFEAPW
jgi:putative endonuclease